MVDCLSGINAFVNNGFGRYSPVEPRRKLPMLRKALRAKAKRDRHRDQV